MSHLCGYVQTVAPLFRIGPDTGEAATSANKWEKSFIHAPAPGGSKFIILHFMNVSLPANNRLEVELGYDKDVFTSADGGSFWTRPINVGAVGAGVTLRYITNGANNGVASLDRYGRAETMTAVEPDHDSITNCNPFMINGWVEPIYPGVPGSTNPRYDAFWICNKNAAPKWQNARCAGPGSVQRLISKSVGMIVSCHQADQYHPKDFVSSCSVTLIDADLVVLAAHCISDFTFEVPTSSVTFDYEVQCDGSLVPSYDAKFYKVIRLVKYRYTDGRDYAVLQLRGLPPVPPVPVRISNMPPNENAFGIHHPNGAVKKISPSASTLQPIKSFGSMINIDLDVAGGSSGSGLFDAFGNIVGVLANGPACDLYYSALHLMMKDPIQIPNPPSERAVMLVFDRSGSMSESAGNGKIKINEARAAASLFVGMVRTTGNKMGLVSFSGDVSNPIDHDLGNVTNGSKNQLTNKIGNINPGGSTSIGDGLAAARDQLAGAASLPKSMLILTDGMENTPAMISSVTGLEPLMITAIGFGQAGNLDGAKLSNLAQTHGGLYKRAGDGLVLKKFFALAFGEIFEAGALADPTYFLPATDYKGQDVPFHVCGEEAITIVIGWDNDNSQLMIELESPTGQIINLAASGIEQQSSSGWAFARVPLPQNGERNGVWKTRVVRPHGGGEFPPPALPLTYFVNVIARGGPSLRPFSQPARLYTGDVIQPRVMLQYADESVPRGGTVSLTVQRPAKSVGTIIAQKGLQPARTVGGDVIPARQSTLQAIEQATGMPVTGYLESNYQLTSDHEDSGTFEAAGIFGKVLNDVLVVEGDYTFHAKASVGMACTATRECQWSYYVSVGIDPDKTPVATQPAGPGQDGKDRIVVIFTPQDRYGNLVGPGMGDDLEVDALPGCTLVGGLVDRGDGSYSQEVDHDPDSDTVPGVTIGQPDRSPVVVAPQSTERRYYSYTAPLACGTVWAECCECTPLVPGRYATAISLLNRSPKPVKVALHVAPTTLAGATAGRWPDTVPFRAEDKIVIEPGRATTIDCCSVAKLLLGAEAPADSAATYGIILIESSAQLDVSATFTSVGDEGTSPSMDVEFITPRELRIREKVQAPVVTPERRVTAQRTPPPRPQDYPAKGAPEPPSKTTAQTKTKGTATKKR
jgi:hypothetical protein